MSVRRAWLLAGVSITCLAAAAAAVYGCAKGQW